MRFNILGPLEVIHNDQLVPLGGLRQRATLGFLLLNANKVVPISRLLEALWSEGAPPTARKIVYNAIAGLRAALSIEQSGADSAALITRVPGYLLRIEPEHLDFYRFQRLAQRGHAELSKGAADTATALLREALGLWRGPALADLVETGVNWSHLSTLQSIRLAAYEDYVEARLSQGRHHEVVTELEALTLSNVPRERMCAQFMLALYRCGRQAEALGIYRQTRNLLVEKLGLDPSRELQELERAILEHDPSLQLSAGGSVIGRPPQEAADERAAQTGGTGDDAQIAPDQPAGPEPAPACIAYASSAERKIVSVLTVQAGLDPHADDDPEDVRAVHAELIARIHAEVGRFGGTMYSSVGSVHTAIFGAPKTTENDAERAVRAALAIRERLSPARMAIGLYQGAAQITVCTGEMLVTRSDSTDELLDVTGTTIDESLRMLRLLSPGEVRVCGATQRSCGDLFMYVPVSADCLTSGVKVAAANQRPAQTMVGTFCGRATEMGILHAELAEIERSRRPRPLMIVGEPGVGKSRLVAEFQQAVIDAARPVRFLTGRAVRFDQAPLAMLGRMVRSYVHIPAEDPAWAVDAKLTSTVHDLVGAGRAATWMVAKLSTLLQPARYAPDDPCMRETLVAFRRFLEEIAARAPLVVVFEDLQWIDDDVLDFVSELATQSVPVPMLVTAVARPEILDRRPRWNGRTLTVGPLADCDTARLIEEVSRQYGLCDEHGDSLTGRALEQFRKALMARVGGIPLFAIEYVRMLRDGHPSRFGTSAAARRADAAGWVDMGDLLMALPRSVHNVVAARLDSLPVTEKAGLKDASIIDGTICVASIAAVGEWDVAEVAARLERLVNRGFLRRNGATVSGHCTYSFRHMIIRDVAYSQLSRRARAIRHHRAARWFEALPGAAPEVLAYHRRLAATFDNATGRPVAAPGTPRAVVAVGLFEDEENIDRLLPLPYALSLRFQRGDGEIIPTHN